MTFFDTGHSQTGQSDLTVAVGSVDDPVVEAVVYSAGEVVLSPLDAGPVAEPAAQLGDPVVDGMTTFQAMCVFPQDETTFEACWSLPQDEPTTFRSDIELGRSTTFSS
jgi:hypothetical protein